MAVSDGQSVRLERRLRLALRLVLYPLAIGLMVLAWQRTHPQTVAHVHGPPPPVHWLGQTSQHQTIRAVTALGRLQALRTSIVMPCDDGSSAGLRVVMTAQNLVRRGDRFEGSQQDKILKDSTGRVMTGRAWVSVDAIGELRGVLTAVAFTADRRVACRARPVSFSSHLAALTRARRALPQVSSAQRNRSLTSAKPNSASRPG
jgi:hypothetical protein